MKFFKKLSGIFLVIFFASCSSGSRSQRESEPTWTQQPTRTVEGGYIIYVGSGEDYSAEKATFKAEASAIQDIANECSFAPKGTRIEDHYDRVSERKHQSFAKIAVSFEDCEEAKSATDPAKIKTLANVAMTDELKRYQDLVYNPHEEAAPPVAVADQNTPSSSPSVRDTAHFFILRQQVAYYKEVVILAPPAAYPPASPQTQQFVSKVQPATTQLQQYEKQNPQTRTWQNSWSKFEKNPGVSLPQTMSRKPATYSRSMGGAPRPSRWAKSARGSGGKRRRRYL